MPLLSGGKCFIVDVLVEKAGDAVKPFATIPHGK
jgi:hypothetical protein